MNEKIVLHNLSKNIDTLLKLLKTFVSTYSFSNNNESLRFDIGHNSNAYVLNLQTMYFYNFRTNESGTVLDLISKYRNIDNSELTYKLYTHFLKIKKFDTQLENVEWEEKPYVLELPEHYDNNSLDIYDKIYSELFLKDNIDIGTQYYWGIRYDKFSKRIIIPVYFNKKLVGAIGRKNTTIVQDYDNKYMPILPYKKSLIFFGFDEYKNLIKQTKKVLIVESEKSVLKMWQMGSKLPTLALGGNSLSRNQIEILKLLKVNKVIFALDKGLEYSDSLYRNINKLKKYGTVKDILYIDVNNIDNSLLKDKESLCDKNELEIKEIFEKHLIWCT